MRDMAMEDREGEVNEAILEVKTVSQSVRKMIRDPLGITAPGALGAPTSILLKNLKKYYPPGKHGPYELFESGRQDQNLKP
jgi:hypothetical protein